MEDVPPVAQSVVVVTPLFAVLLPDEEDPLLPAELPVPEEEDEEEDAAEVAVVPDPPHPISPKTGVARAAPSKERMTRRRCTVWFNLTGG